MRLISWNVNRRVTRLDEQAAAVAGRAPDVVCLQEVTPASARRWVAALGDAGLAHARCSLDDADPARAPAGPRRTGVLVAAREALGPAEAVEPVVPWPESVLAVHALGADVVCAHVPNAANGWIKPDTLRALHTALAAPRARGVPRILCGDLNTPRREHADGTLWTFAQDSRGTLRPERGERWDRAERDVLTALPGMTDVFRAVNGPAATDVSWTWRRWPRSGYRLDHVLASTGLRPAACRYHHEWRTGGLSDHAAVEADLQPTSA